MLEIYKRFLTAAFLFTILIISINNIFFLIFALVFIFHQIIYEFNIILVKIYNNKKKIIFLVLIFLLIYLCSLLLYIFGIFLNNSFELKLIFYLIITICIATDIGGYVFGKFFKGKKISKISPNKTYSGLIGSYILSFLASILIFDQYIDINRIILMTFIISSISQLGDLFISLLKRKAKCKDTGNLLPGHGGLLDRFDGLIFALPLGFSLTWII